MGKLPQSVVDARQHLCRESGGACGLRELSNPCFSCAKCGVVDFDCEENTQEQENSVGLGDLVHTVAGPVARILGMECFDPSTHKLKPQSPCDHRRQKWNAVRIPVKGKKERRKKI